MNVIIKETGNQETLRMVDRNTNVNWAQDFIGNQGGLSDGQFTYDNEQAAYICDQDTFDWWQKVISDQQELDERIAELVDVHGDKVQEVVNNVGSYDLEDFSAAVNRDLDEAFGEQSGK